jgi:drug/metabolite transporter (DMT)-like permease
VPRVFAVLFAALAAVSASGTLVRLAPAAHPLAVGFWRTAIVAALLSPTVRRVTRRDLGFIVLAGACLAGHFWAWFVSLHATSVMRATVLVCCTPLWTGLLETVLLRAAPPRRYWVGIGISLLGVAGMAGSGAGGSAPGDLLAAFGGVLSAAYLVTGRSVRQRVGIGPYGALVCAAAAAWTLPVALASGAPLTGFDPPTWGVLVALALGPQLVGHLGFNYAVGYVPAVVVAAVILLEPVGATAIAAGVLGERPNTRELVAAGVVLVGVAVAVLPGWRRRRRAPAVTVARHDAPPPEDDGAASAR